MLVKKCMLDLSWVRSLTTNIQIVPGQLVESPTQFHNQQVLRSLPRVPNLPEL